MDLKEAIYNTVLSNLHNSSIREVYDKAITLVSPIENSTLTVYLRVHSYNGFTRYNKTYISKEVFNEITGDNSFHIPVTGYGNQYSLEYGIPTVNGSIEHMEAILHKPDLTIYNKLMSYEKEMLDGHSRGEGSDQGIAS